MSAVAWRCSTGHMRSGPTDLCATCPDLTGGVDGREHPDEHELAMRDEIAYLKRAASHFEAEYDNAADENAALLVRVETAEAALAERDAEIDRLRAIVNAQKANGGIRRDRHRLYSEVHQLKWKNRRAERERDEAQAALRRVTELCDERSARAPEDALVDQDDAALGWFARHILAAIQASPTPPTHEGTSDA